MLLLWLIELLVGLPASMAAKLHHVMTQLRARYTFAHLRAKLLMLARGVKRIHAKKILSFLYFVTQVFVLEA